MGWTIMVHWYHGHPTYFGLAEDYIGACTVVSVLLGQYTTRIRYIAVTHTSWPVYAQRTTDIRPD